MVLLQLPIGEHHPLCAVASSKPLDPWVRRALRQAEARLGGIVLLINAVHGAIYFEKVQRMEQSRLR